MHPGARMVYVGKAAGFHTRTQEEIHALLQARAPHHTATAAHEKHKRRPLPFFARGRRDPSAEKGCARR